MELAGKTALITGASQGLGAATARAMAARGARVLLLARTEEKLREVADSIESGGGQAEIFAVDLSDLEALVTTTEAIKAAGTIPDVIVNNAGIGRWLFIEETPLEEMQADMALPYFAAFGVTKAFVAEMAGRGSGNICNVNGPGAWFPWPSSWPIRRRAGRCVDSRQRCGSISGHRGVGDRCRDDQDLEQLLGEQPGSRRPDALDRPVIPTLSEERAAEVVTRAVERERREATAPPMYTAFHHLGRIFPRLVHWTVYRGGAAGRHP